MTEDRASERLFAASKVTAIELAAMPMTALKAAKSTLVRMPMALVRMMILSRSALLASMVGFCLSILPLLLFQTKSYQYSGIRAMAMIFLLG